MEKYYSFIARSTKQREDTNKRHTLKGDKTIHIGDLIIYCYVDILQIYTKWTNCCKNVLLELSQENIDL